MVSEFGSLASGLTSVDGSLPLQSRQGGCEDFPGAASALFCCYLPVSMRRLARSSFLRSRKMRLRFLAPVAFRLL